MDISNTPTGTLSDGLPRILPPSENGIFQTVLTLPESAPALLGLLSAVLGREIKKVTLRNNDAPSRDKDAKREEYDINCVVDGEDGDQCDVEMQASPMEGDSGRNDHRNIKWRSAYNLCDLHANQSGRGLRYGNFVRSYQVMLCNYPVFAYDHALVERFTLRNPNGKELCDAVTAIFIDLAMAEEIARKSAYRMTKIEMWSVFFALADKPEHGALIAEITKQTEEIAVAYETLIGISQSPEERARFRSRRKWLQDREHEHAVWKDEGRAEGEAKGRAEGEAKGRAEGEAKGRAEGEAKGRAEGRADVARNALKVGMSVADIMNITGLTREEIETLGKAD